MDIWFDDNVDKNQKIYEQVTEFLKQVETLEVSRKSPVTIYQDGKSKGYYIKCGIQASAVCPLLDMSAKLSPVDEQSFRANRELLLEHNTYKRMVSDAREGREFNDIIVE